MLQAELPQLTGFGYLDHGSDYRYLDIQDLRTRNISTLWSKNDSYGQIQAQTHELLMVSFARPLIDQSCPDKYRSFNINMQQDTPKSSTSPIAKIPNELLSKTLAMIPWTREQHDTLELVNKSFKATITHTAFRKQVCENRFAEMYTLSGSKTPSLFHLC